jgi:hypothetical protein
MSMASQTTRRRFLRQVACISLPVWLPKLSAAANVSGTNSRPAFEFLHEVANAVLASAAVPPGARIPGGPTNTTGYKLRLPGGTQNYYPAFWIRDAAMMLGADLIPADEIEGWVRVIAATQPGPEGLSFGKLRVPPYSIPDHITLTGEACWFPGAYAEQGNGAYGFLPPADDAFFFIQMVYEHWRLTGELTFLRSTVKTDWGEQRLAEVCVKAFDSVAANSDNGLVICEATEGRTRVDWGFCDSIRKTGLCLMPSLLRWRAAQQLAVLLKANGESTEAESLRGKANRIRSAIVANFFHQQSVVAGQKSGCLISATELGRKDDVWASAFAIWLGVLPRNVELQVARHLLALYEGGSTVAEGQVRHLPLTGEFGGNWEQASCPAGQYQNGGFWATPTGWLVVALRHVDKKAADHLLADYLAHLRTNREQGAPWEWINPIQQKRVNPLYVSSAGLVYVALTDNGRLSL